MYKENRRGNNKYYRKTMNNTYEGQDFVPHKDSRPPRDDGKGAYSRTIDLKMMSGLPNSSYAMKVDPYTEANNPSTPYSFLSSFNKVLGGRYAGRENLMGGNLIQYNNSFNSKFLKVFDTALLSIGLNYNYLPVLASASDRGKGMVDEVRKAIDEVVSSLNATTFRDQNIFYYAVETDLPMGSATTTTLKINEGGSEKTVNVYTNLTDVIYAYCMEYQLILQNIIMSFNMFNAFRTRMGTMIRMSWDREVAVLNSYFGLLKKKSFLSLFDSISQNIAGEYVDQEFMRQANTFCMAASRRSNCINDPLLEISAMINMPSKFKAYICTGTDKKTYAGTVYDYDKMSYTNPLTGKTIKFADAVRYLQIRLTVTDTLDWARSLSATVSEADRFNEIKFNLDALTANFTYFKTAMNDIRTVLTIMSRVGVVKWTLGTRLTVTKDTDCVITNYLVVNNVYEMVFSGSPNATFNATTYRWRTFVPWNIYYGTPEYANYSGGAFFTFSTKDLVLPNDFAQNHLIDYVPVAFGVIPFGAAITPDHYCVAVARDGSRAYLTQKTAVMSTNKVLSRLVPLASQKDFATRLPQPASLELMDTDDTTAYRAFLYRLMLQICGFGQSEDNDFALDPDIIAIYEYEVEDFTNEVIAFARSHGPFQVSQYTENTLGFYGLKQA